MDFRSFQKITNIFFLSILTCHTAHAQTMAYSSLEKIFEEPVTTSVTGSPQRASQVPATMEIVTAEDIRRSGAQDIPGILKHVVGVDVLQWTRNEADVGIRGYNQAFSPRLLVLINGRQVYADYYGYTPWSTLPIELSEIRQIEIVKGPNSALFGFNAVSGVINILTYNPLTDNITTTNLIAGTQRLTEGTAVLTKQFGKNLALRVGAGKRLNQDFTSAQNPVDVGKRRGNKRNEIHMDLRMQFTDKAEGGLSAGISNATQPEFTPLFTTVYPHYNTKFVKTTFAMDSNYGLIQATAYKNWISSVDPLTVYFIFRNEVTVGRVQDVFKIGSDHTFSILAEYRHNRMRTTDNTAIIFYNVASGDAMWHWQIIPKVTFTNALRFDHLKLGRSGPQPAGFYLNNSDWNTHTFNEKSFNSGVVWEADNLDTLRFIIGRGVQLPNMIDLGGLLTARPPFFITSGIPYLNPTAVMNYEINWDRLILPIDGKFRFSIFHIDTHNLTANSGRNIFTPIPTSTPTNVGNSQATGLELSIKGKFQKAWRWGLSYTPEVLHDRFWRDMPLRLIGVDYADTTPLHVVNANLGWANDQWEIDGYLRYQSSFFGITAAPQLGTYGPLLRINRYIQVDARAAYKLTKNITLALSGQGITHAQQRQTSAPMVERRVEGTLTVDF